MKPSIVIPTYNNKTGLLKLLKQLADYDGQIIVVDNKPTEEKKKKIKELDSRLRGNDTSMKSIMYLPQKKNLGFAGGVNKGAKNIETKWMLILNDDVEFKDNATINQLIKVTEAKKIDALSPILRNPDGKIENIGYKVFPYGKIKLIKELRITDYELDGLTAACLLVKTKVFKKLKGFDESFFAYLEDVDFFLRFKKAGYKMGIADVEVLHNHMATTSTMGNFKAKQDMINWWRLFFKHPEKFKFNLAFIVERMRNVSGYIKASLNNSKVKS